MTPVQDFDVVAVILGLAILLVAGFGFRRGRKPTPAAPAAPDAPETSVEQRMQVGIAQFKAGELAEAEAQFRRVLNALDVADPACAPVYDYLGCALAQQGDRTGALVAFGEALKLEPNLVSAHCNRGMELLAAGDYEAGWQEMEWRWQRPEYQPIRKLFSGCEWWDGSPLQGRTILLFAEQGLGDAVQFARYVPVIAARGGRVAVDCHPPLRGLFGSLRGVRQVLQSDAEIASYQLCAPLMGLPRLLGTTAQTIPSEFPYLRATEEHTQKWRERLQRWSGLKVGVAWACSPEAQGAWRRSVSLEMLAPLSEVPGVTLFSLQIGSGPTEASGLVGDLALEDMTAELLDFQDTAGFLANMDLVISVETVFSHLAAAMGRPTWLMLSRAADWRWGSGTGSSPWYPGARLFRKRDETDWSDVIEDVERQLRTAARNGPPAAA